MENKLIEVVDAFPNIIKNTHLNVNLQGWPAAVTAIALCCARVAAYAIKATTPSEAPSTQVSPDVAQAPYSLYRCLSKNNFSSFSGILISRPILILGKSGWFTI